MFSFYPKFIIITNQAKCATIFCFQTLLQNSSIYRNCIWDNILCRFLVDIKSPKKENQKYPKWHLGPNKWLTKFYFDGLKLRLILLNGSKHAPIAPCRNSCNHLAKSLKLFFFNVGPPKKSIFLTTFYGLYFSHQYTNITIFFKYLSRLPFKFYFCFSQPRHGGHTSAWQR